MVGVPLSEHAHGMQACTHPGTTCAKHKGSRRTKDMWFVGSRGHNVDERGVDAEEFARDVELAGKRRNIKLYNRLITK